jgi:hypothetical protein
VFCQLEKGVLLMMRHIAMFEFTDDVTDEDVRAIDAGLGRLPDAIEEIRNYSFGIDLGLGDGNFDYAVVGEFDSVEDFRTYLAHPEHVRVSSTLIKPVLKNVVRIQMEIS